MKLHTLGIKGLGLMGLVALAACAKDASHVSRSLQGPVASGTEAGEPGAEVLTAPAAAAQALAGGGTLRGIVTFKGVVPAPATIAASTDPACEGMERTSQAVRVKNGRLENVLVRLLGTVSGQPAAPRQPVIVNQQQCTYLPRVQGAVTGQSILVKNSDGTLHNVRVYSGAKSIFNVAYPPTGKPMQRPLPADAEFIHLECGIHTWMEAWVVVNPNPYFTTSGADGSFTLQGVPAGTYTLEAWHEVLGSRTARVTVKEGEETTVSFEFSAMAPKLAGTASAKR